MIKVRVSLHLSQRFSTRGRVIIDIISDGGSDCVRKDISSRPYERNFTGISKPNSCKLVLVIYCRHHHLQA